MLSYPKNEDQRRHFSLKSLDILRHTESDFDALASLARHICGTPKGFVHFLDQEHQYTKASVVAKDAVESSFSLSGLLEQTAQSTSQNIHALEQIPLSYSFCTHTLAQYTNPLVINDTLDDYRTQKNPLAPVIRFYAAMSIIDYHGVPIGTLGVMDTKPHSLLSGQIDFLKDLARQAGILLESRSSQQLYKATLSRLKETQQQLDQASLVDPLTGLKTNTYLSEVLDSELRRSRRYQHDLSYVVIQLDRLEEIIHLQGNHIADLALQNIAKTLSVNARSTDLIARTGEDEFALLLPNTTFEGAWALAEKLRFEVENQDLKTTISLGAATLKASDQTVHEMVTSADQALRRARSAGGNKVAQCSRNN